MTLTESISHYEYVRVLILGNEVGLRIRQPTPNPGSSEFDAFVTSAYLAVRETLAEDASFLTSVGALGEHQATRSVYLLRTAAQHEDNPHAVRFRRDWVGQEPIAWDDAIDRLVGQLDDYVLALVAAANSVRNDPLLTQKWKESSSVSVPTIFASVCRDLGLHFARGATEAKVRAIEGRYRREKPAGPKEKVVADFCVQEALSESGVLPVDYTELLDELGVLGSRDAPAALALAYATGRAHPRLSGDGFKRKTSEMWWSLIQT